MLASGRLAELSKGENARRQLLRIAAVTWGGGIQQRPASSAEKEMGV